MLRSRTKRPESWKYGRSDLPTSRSSRLFLLQKHRLSQRGSGLVYMASRYLKHLLLMLVPLILVVVLYICIPAGRYRTSYFKLESSKASHNVTMQSMSKLDGRSLPRGKPPMVDRSILDKLVLLDQSAEDPDEYRSSSPENKHAWPPAVTRIPEPQLPVTLSNAIHYQFQHEPISTASPAEFDLSICGADACRFILPLRIAEQESKSRLHFLQILELAGSLNRIAVLPNVGKSRMGICLRWNFEKYYDVEALQVRPDAGRSRLIDTETFRRWTATRPNKPNGQLVSINSKPLSRLASSDTLFFENGVTVKVEQDQDPSSRQNARCIKAKFPRLGLEAYSPLSIYPSKGLKNKPFGTKIAKALLRDDVYSISLRESDAAEADSLDVGLVDSRDQEEDQNQDLNYAEHSSEPEVLILDYDLRHPAFATSQISPSLSYSPNLTALAANLIAPLAPGDYLVIHWRMETVPPYELARCAESLVSALAGLLRRQADVDDATGTHNTKRVWFASDYPHPISRLLPQNINQYQAQNDAGSKSSTFRGIGRQHEEAIEILRRAFDKGGALEGRRITGLAEELVRVRAAAAEDGKMGVGIEGELTEDSGILGILDKIVAIRAGLFVSGGKGCGRARYVVPLVEK